MSQLIERLSLRSVLLQLLVQSTQALPQIPNVEVMAFAFGLGQSDTFDELVELRSDCLVLLCQSLDLLLPRLCLEREDNPPLLNSATQPHQFFRGKVG